MKWFWLSTTDHAYDTESHRLVAANNEDHIQEWIGHHRYHSIRIRECFLNLPKPRYTKHPHIYNPWSLRP